MEKRISPFFYFIQDRTDDLQTLCKARLRGLLPQTIQLLVQLRFFLLIPAVMFLSRRLEAFDELALSFGERYLVTIPHVGGSLSVLEQCLDLVFLKFVDKCVHMNAN